MCLPQSLVEFVLWETHSTVYMSYMSMGGISKRELLSAVPVCVFNRNIQNNNNNHNNNRAVVAQSVDGAKAEKRRVLGSSPQCGQNI